MKMQRTRNMVAGESEQGWDLIKSFRCVYISKPHGPVTGCHMEDIHSLASKVRLVRVGCMIPRASENGSRVRADRIHDPSETIVVL